MRSRAHSAGWLLKVVFGPHPVLARLGKIPSSSTPVGKPHGPTKSPYALRFVDDMFLQSLVSLSSR